MGPVAIELLGQPTEKRLDGQEWRYGQHGSLSVRVDTGTFKSHKPGGPEGGLIDLVRWKVGGDKAGAIRWLKEHGHLTGDAPPPKALSKRRQVATYCYTDAAGSLLYEVVRYEPKTFRQRRPDGQGGWNWDMDGVQRVLYRLPELLTAIDAGEPVFVVEGEKDVDNLRQLGFAATCNSGGAGKWTAEHNQWLNGADVVIAGDNDEVGRKHVADVAAKLIGAARRVRVLEIPGAKDISEWIQRGGTVEQLEALADAAPEHIAGKHQASDEEGAASPCRTFGNLKLLSVEDALDAPMRTYLLEGLLAPGELSVWWGRPKCGKSFLLLRLAYGLSQGSGMWGREALLVPVLYVAAEGESGIKGRIRALHDALGTAPAFKFIAQRVNLFDPDADLTDVIAAAEAIGAGLVVIDTLARVMGAGDENKTPDMNAFVSNLDRVREEVTTKPHVAVIHHGGWDGNHARGSIALVGAADLVVKVGGEEGGPRSATVEYAKDDAGVDVLGFKLDVADLPADAKGRVRSTCLAVEAEPAAEANVNGRALTEDQRGWLRDLEDMFGEPGLAEIRTPRAGMSACLTLSREQVRTGFRRCGRLESGPDVSLTGRERERMRNMLNKLKDKGKLAMTSDLVWLIEPRQVASGSRQA